MAKLFILIGVLFLVAGVVLLVFPNALSWFGKLPGDVNYQSSSGNLRVHFPVITMIVISVVATVLLNLFIRR